MGEANDFTVKAFVAPRFRTTRLNYRQKVIEYTNEGGPSHFSDKGEVVNSLPGAESHSLEGI